MGKLFNTREWIKFTKKEWDELTDKDKQINNFYCPLDYPYLCTINSKSFGLCKKNIRDCYDIYSDSKIPIIPIKNKNEEFGEKFGYYTNNLTKRCLQVYKDYEYISETKSNLPESFKILTYNIWGLMRESKSKEHKDFLLEIIEIRMKAISDEIIKENPDIICFQEMSNPAYKVLEKYLGNIYNFKYEMDFNHDKHINTRKRNVEVHMFSKIPANKISIYGIDGNQHYRDSLLIAEFNNAIIVNCYLQSGSKYSPGQESYWYHHSRCRMDQLIKIKELIENYSKTVILTGDFNFHLDGKVKDWPELAMIERFKADGFIDTFRQVNPKDAGFTEDTDFNAMRWNQKLIEKIKTW